MEEARSSPQIGPMANELYSNVMYALQEILEYDIVFVGALRRFVIFNVLICMPYFL